MQPLRLARFRPPLILLAVTALAVCQSSTQADLERGKQAFEQFDYETAYQIFKPLADAGITEAQELMGELCDHGFPHVPTKDPDKPIHCSEMQAANWHKLAAVKGDPKAQCELGVNLHIYQDKGTESFEWMLKSAEQAYPGCMCSVGEYYRGGWSPVKQNYGEALKWFKTAEDRGESCHFNLGIAYYLGQGVEADYKTAGTYLEKEAVQKYSSHHADASEVLGSIYEQGAGESSRTIPKPPGGTAMQLTPRRLNGKSPTKIGHASILVTSTFKEKVFRKTMGKRSNCLNH